MVFALNILPRSPSTPSQPSAPRPPPSRPGGGVPVPRWADTRRSSSTPEGRRCLSRLPGPPFAAGVVLLAAIVPEGGDDRVCFVRFGDDDEGGEDGEG